jgi:regulator-associated protein of mTOR
MRDPTINMEQDIAAKPQATSLQAEPRKNQKSVRVAFGPDLDTYIPPRDKSPAPPSGHHRSYTTVEHSQPSISSLHRPASSSGEDNAAVFEPSPRLTSDRASDSSGRPTAALKRARSDYGPRLGFDKSAVADDEEDFAMRHGWQEEYTSSEYLKVLHSVSSRHGVTSPGALGPDDWLTLSRTFICTSQRSGTIRTASQETQLEAGPVRIGA